MTLNPRPDQDTDPPAAVLSPGGAAGVFKGRLVVVSGTTGAYSGVFVYSPSPGAGTLKASMSNGGTDPYGNKFNPGVETFDSSGRTLTMADDTIEWSKLTDTPDVPAAIDGVTSKASGNSLELTTGEGNIASNPGAMTLYDSAQAATLGLSLASGSAAIFTPTTCPLVSDVWANFGSLSIGGWTVGSAKFKFLADSGLVAIRIQNLSPSTHPADGTTIWSSANGLPTDYRPAITERHVVYSQNQGSEAAALSFETDGSITIYGIGGTTTNRIDTGTITISTI